MLSFLIKSFFAYFGALTALEESNPGRIVPTPPSSNDDTTKNGDTTTEATSTCGLMSAAGGSAGAMAAVMLSAGIHPRIAAEFAFSFTWGMVSDPPGLGGYVKGNNFEECMRTFIKKYAKIRRDPPMTGSTGNVRGDNDDDTPPFRLEEALVPVAVSVFDLLRMSGVNLSRGCMARAARSSAGFPGLFQPVAWREEEGDGDNDDDDANNGKEKRGRLLPDSLLIDGGITDGLGLNGLACAIPPCTAADETKEDRKEKRVINMVVGDFGFKGPRGLKDIPPGVDATSLVSIAIVNTPLCGPWAMKNGPRAYESARRAMEDMLDVPMERGADDNHYVLRVDASRWLDL